MSDMNYETARPEDLSAIVDLLVEAYHCDRTAATGDLERRGLHSFRLIRGPNRVEACLELVLAGQWIAGKRLPTGAIAMVATRLESRGAGAATALIRSALAELRSSGIALSTLFGAAESLYRKLGYERAGSMIRYDLPLAQIPARRREGAIVQVSGPRHPAIQQIYRQCARRDNGLLDREASFWAERFDPLPGAALACYVAWMGQEPEGYVLIDQNPHQGRVVLREVVFTTRRAGERLLALLADHAMQFEAVRWWGGPQDPLAELLPEQQAVATPHKQWMLRLVDLRRALEGRGYPPQLTARLSFDVADSLFAENAGRWELAVEAGAAKAQRGGEGTIRLDVGALAALATGHAPPARLALLDRMVGPAEDLALAGLVFQASPPYMNDAF